MWIEGGGEREREKGELIRSPSHRVAFPFRLFGVTTLDVVRASTFVSEVAGVPTKAPDCESSSLSPASSSRATSVESRFLLRVADSLSLSPFPFVSFVSFADTIPVIGGHSGVTIVPLLSQSKPALPTEVLESEEKLAAIVKRIQFGGDGQSSPAFNESSEGKTMS